MSTNDTDQQHRHVWQHLEDALYAISEARYAALEAWAQKGVPGFANCCEPAAVTFGARITDLADWIDQLSADVNDFENWQAPHHRASQLALYEQALRDITAVKEWDGFDPDLPYNENARRYTAALGGTAAVSDPVEGSAS